MENKVYVISPYTTGLNWREMVEKSRALDADIQRLAKEAGDDSVHMRYWKPHEPASPTVVVECSEAFLDKIKRLPLFHFATEASLPTIRRSDMPQIEAPEATARPRRVSAPRASL